jgi:tetratricopeptide (TPR) repeat protein
MTPRFRKFLIVPSAWLASLVALAGSGVSHAESLKLDTFRTHSRLSFRVDDGVVSDFKPTEQGFELMLKGQGLSDLGAPLGEEAAWAERFKNLRDPRLASLEFAEVEGGLKVRGLWKFGHGPDDPANPVMEAFDYRERERSALVLDFWVKEGPTFKQVSAHREATRRIASVKKHESDEKARAERRIAREKARAEAEDPRRFCRTPLSSRSDIFLEFLPVHEPVVFARWFQTGAPDADYPYFEPQGKAKDAQYVRLALKLYRDGNFALANRTIDFLEQEVPGSTFRSEMRFLRANALLKLGLTEEGNSLLKEIQREAKPTRVSLQAGMYLTLQQWEAKNYLGALESFSGLAEKHSGNKLAWVFHLGAAECARALRQTDRAVLEYQWVADRAPTRAERAEGALRIGDLYLDRFQYDQALAAYAQALRQFGPESGSFPSVHINRADALYGLGQFDRASDAYKSFMDRFPAHPAGWRAAYRLGEAVARADGSTREAPEARRRYLETINRYPFSPGAVLARLQLLPCGDHGGLTQEASERFFAGEAEKYDGGGQVSMDRYKDFRALSRVRTLMTQGRQEEAVASAISELQRVPRAEARRWLSRLLTFNFRKSVLEHLDSGQPLAALTFYQNNADTVPMLVGGVDPSYLLRLSQAASDLGLGKLAQSIGAVFAKATKAYEAGRGLASDKIDLGDDPDARLAASERAFTEAKARWIGDGMKAADGIRARLGQVSPESRFSYERELILSLIDEKSGDSRGALRHAAQAQLLGPKDNRVDAWVARLQARVGDPGIALASYRALEPFATQASKPEAAPAHATASERLGIPPVPSREELILAECEILESQGRWGESAANYARAVDQGLGGVAARFGYARALIKSGDGSSREKALETLEKLATEGPAPAAPGASVAARAPGSQDQDEGADKPAAQALAKAPSDGAAGSPGPRDKFWRKLASEMLADEKAKNSAKEGTKP